MQGGREGGQGEYREFGLWTPNLKYLEKFGSIWFWSKSKLFGNQFGEIPTWAKRTLDLLAHHICTSTPLQRTRGEHVSVDVAR